MVTCSYDFLSSEWNKKSFILYAFIGNYVFPMILMAFFYVKIVKAVVAHEKQLKELAAKMNVNSIRSNVSTPFYNEDSKIHHLLTFFSIE